jgi:hypothetical protein
MRDDEESRRWNGFNGGHFAKALQMRWNIHYAGAKLANKSKESSSAAYKPFEQLLNTDADVWMLRLRKIHGGTDGNNRRLKFNAPWRPIFCHSKLDPWRNKCRPSFVKRVESYIK